MLNEFINGFTPNPTNPPKKGANPFQTPCLFFFMLHQFDQKSDQKTKGSSCLFTFLSLHAIQTNKVKKQEESMALYQKKKEERGRFLPPKESTRRYGLSLGRSFHHQPPAATEQRV